MGNICLWVKLPHAKVDVTVDLGEEEGDLGVGGEAVEVVQAGVGDPDGIKIGAIAGHILRIGKIKKDENLIRVNQMPKECGNLLLVCGNTFAKAVWVWVVLCIKEGQTVDFTRIIEDVQRPLNLVLVYHTPLQLSQRCGLVRQAVPGDILRHLREKTEGTAGFRAQIPPFSLVRLEGIDERHCQHRLTGTFDTQKGYISHDILLIDANGQHEDRAWYTMPDGLHDRF